jgi:hypothetical protein
MADDGVVRVESRVGRRPSVIGGGQEVGRGDGRARAAGEEQRKNGEKVGGNGGDGDHFKSVRRGGGG